MKCPRCNTPGFEKGWEWLCNCDGRTIAIDSYSTPRFNQGLGCYVSSVRDSEKKARQKGLEPIGDARMDQVFKPKDDRAMIRREILEARKQLRAMEASRG